MDILKQEMNCIRAKEVLEKYANRNKEELTLEEKEDYEKAVTLATKSLMVLEEIPKIVKIIENYKDPIPQNLYARRKNGHYDTAILLLKGLLEKKDILSTDTTYSI